MARIANRVFLIMLVLVALAATLVLARGFWYAGRTIFDLLAESRKLRRVIANLTAESQIGFAKVLSQYQRDGRTYTRLVFVETARDDPTVRILEKEYEIEGDIVHFDALIIKFTNEYVADGRGRSLYLWHRIYGENQAPATGFPIEEPGTEPARYKDIFRTLPLRDRALFWSEIWKLSNEPDRLKSVGVQAIYGTVVYKKLRPGFLYVFRISNTGQVYPETLPAI